MVVPDAQKRKAEDVTAAMATETLGQSDQPAMKKLKTEQEDTPISVQPVKSEPAATDAGMTETKNDIHQAAEVKQEVPPNAETSQEDKAEDASNHTADMPEAEADADPPQKLGFKTFKSGDEAFQFFHTLVHVLRHDQDLNEVASGQMLLSCITGLLQCRVCSSELISCCSMNTM